MPRGFWEAAGVEPDRIAVVEHGELAEVGTHEELIARNGRYAEMFSAWRQTHEDPAQPSL